MIVSKTRAGSTGFARDDFGRIYKKCLNEFASQLAQASVAYAPPLASRTAEAGATRYENSMEWLASRRRLHAAVAVEPIEPLKFIAGPQTRVVEAEESDSPGEFGLRLRKPHREPRTIDHQL